MGAGGVCQHEGVLVLLVLEEVQDSILFHEPGDEVEIRFAILDAIVPRLETPLEHELEIAEPEVSEDLRNDVGDGHPLEDAAIRGARQEPEPGHHFGPIIGEALITAALGEAADEAVDIAIAAVGQSDRQRHLLADDVVKGDRGVFREQIQVKAEELRNPFMAREPLQEQNVPAQRSVDGNESVVLGV